MSPQAVARRASAISGAIVIASSALDDPFAFLASLFASACCSRSPPRSSPSSSFAEPSRTGARPFKVPLNVRIRGAECPLPAVVGAAATFAIWIAAMATHPAARYAGPAWLAVGLVVYLLVRRERGAGLLEHVTSTDERVVPEATFTTILVPMKLGDIGEEMVATAVKLAQERGGSVEALHVIRVPLELPLDAALEEQEWHARGIDRRGEGARRRPRRRGPRDDRPRALDRRRDRQGGRANGADLIVLGSAPRWRRQSRFFSPTVDYVLKKASSEVLIVAFPQGVLEEIG